MYTANMTLLKIHNPCCSHLVQELQKSEGSVQETSKDPLLYRWDAHFVHLQEINHHLFVQLYQPLEDWRLKPRPPVSCHKAKTINMTAHENYWSCHVRHEKKSSYPAPSEEPLLGWWVIWQMGWQWSHNYFGHWRVGILEGWGRAWGLQCLEESCSVWEWGSFLDLQQSAKDKEKIFNI